MLPRHIHLEKRSPKIQPKGNDTHPEKNAVGQISGFLMWIPGRGTYRNVR